MVSDHKTLQSVLKSNKGNKTFSSRLTRWVDRLWPFDFNVVRTPGRTLGMAGYLSRHPSPYEGNVEKVEEMFNKWFTFNVINEIKPTLNKAKRTIESKLINSQNSEKELNTQVLTVHASVHKVNQSKQVDKLAESKTMAEQHDLENSKMSTVCVQANYEMNKTIQKVIRLVKDREVAVISLLPPKWREKFNSFIVHENGLLFMVYRLVIPKDMRENVLRAIHFGHAGRDSMLKEAADVWWPRIHRQIVEKAQKCAECLKAGKHLKCIKSQNEFEKYQRPAKRMMKFH